MSRAPRRTVVLESRSEIDAISSPLRQEIVVVLGELGPSPVKAIAARLGRSPHALYPHVRRLLAASILRVSETRRVGKRDEAWYALAGNRVMVGRKVGSSAARSARSRVVAAALRSTAREVAAALERKDVQLEGPKRQLVAMRAHLRLSSRQLVRVNRLFRDLQSILREARRASSDDRVYAVTFVLTPTRQRR